MAQTIKLKRSNTSGSKPTTSNLALGEIALNTKDGLFFLRRNVDGTDSNDTIRAYTPEYLTEYDSQIDVTVTVASKTSAHPQNGTGSSNGYLLDGLEGPFLVLIPGNTYRFDQSDSTNSGHPFRFYLEADKTTSYTTGVTTNGTAGSSGAYTQIAVTESTPQVLYYQCSSHAYMGSGAFINSGAVTSTQIQANAVTAGKIASNSILTRHIDDNQIGIDQLNVSDGTSGQALTTNGSGTLSFSDVASSLASASDSDIDATTLASGQILVYDGSNSFDNVSVSGDATLASDGTLTIATNAIESTMIAQNSILTKHIDDNQIGIDQLNVTDGSSGQVLTTDGAGTLSFSTVSSGSASDSFKTITISGQSDVVADSATDTLTLAAGTGITLTTNASTDTITITGTTGLSANSVTATEIATGAVGASELASTAVTPGSYTLASITVDADGRITSASSGGSTVADGSITTAKLADDAVTAAKLADTAVTAGTYGSSTASPQITVDAQGRITSVSNQTISGGGGAGGIGLNLTVDVHEATGDGSTTAFDTGTTISSEDFTTVFVDGVYQEKGTYSTSGSTVTFSSAPPNGVSVEINNLANITTGGALSHSSFNGDGSTTAFTLPKAPDSETDLIVFVDGVYQNNDSFNVSGTTLTFDTAPANGTKVIAYTIGGVVTGKTHLVDTFDGDASTTAFTLSLDPVSENNTMVYVGGVYQPKGTYSISGTTLTFSEAPPSGTGNIEVNIGQVTTTTDVGANAVNAAAIAANAVGSSEIAGNAVTATQIAAGAVGASEISTSSTPTFAGANITNTSTSDSLLITTTEDSSTAAPVITLKRNSGSPADADYIGQLKFKGENDADQAVTYAKITGKIDDASDGTEKGIIEFAHIREGSQYITGRWKSDELQLLNSTGLQVAGATDLNNTLNVSGHLSLDGTTNELRFYEGSNYVGFEAPSLSADQIWVLPTADGSNGQALVTNGSGTLSFATISSYTDSDVESYLDGGTSTPTFASGVVSGDLTVDTSTLKVDSSNNRVGIGNASPDVSLDIGSFTDAVHMPVGTTAQRPASPAAGYFRYNSDDGQFEGYTTEWGAIAGSGASALETNNFTGDGSTTAFTVSSSVSDEDNLMVFIEGVYQNKADYVASGTTITFDVAPANGRKIVVHHVRASIAGSNCIANSFTGDGSTTAFTLTQNPASENNTQVFLDGVYQLKNSYSVSGTTLTFDAAPPNSTAIEVMMFTSTDLNTLPSSFVSGLTEVTATGSDHLMVLDATDNSLKKALASDLIETVGSTPTFTTATVTGDLTVDTSTLKVDSTNARVGIGTASPSNGKLEVTGTYTGNLAYFNQAGTGGGNHGVEINNASTSAWTLLTKVGGTAKFGVTGDVVYVSDKLHIGTYTNGANPLEIHNDAPIITIRDTNGTGTAAIGYIEWEDSAGTALGYVGLGSGSTSTLHVANYTDNARVDFLTNSETQFAVTNKDNADSEDIAVLMGTATGGTDVIDAIRMTKMGYGASYQCTQFGVAGGGRNISLMYDPSTNTNGGFGGNGECIVGNGFKLLGANAANNGFIGMMRLAGDNTLRIGGNYTVGGWLTFDTSGNATFSGSLSKGSGSFKIDHPLESKRDTHHLVHSFVEAPQADNIYRGKVDLVDGSATVNIDTVAGMTEGTFAALNREVQCFTSNESDWDAVKGSVSGNILTILSQNTSSTATISWLVVGERKDQHMYDTEWTDENGKVIVEPEKVEELEEEISAAESEENA